MTFTFQPVFLQGFDTGSLLFFGAMMLVFWFFLLRPQAKKQKEQRTFMESLQKGDDVVTTSGFLGRINKIEGDIVTIELGNKNFVRVTKNSISKEMTDAVYAGGKNKSKEEDKDSSN